MTFPRYPHPKGYPAEQTHRFDRQEYLVLIADQEPFKPCVLNAHIVLDAAVVEDVPAEGKGGEKANQAVAVKKPVTVANGKPDRPADGEMGV